MPAYTETELLRARRPLADAGERGDAACTLGHLETEQRDAPTPERAKIIGEVSANIAAFDGVPAPTTVAPSASPELTPVAPPAPAPLPAVASSIPTPGELQTGIAASRVSMERTLRAQGMTPVGEPAAGDSIGATSMARTLRRMGVAPLPVG